MMSDKGEHTYHTVPVQELSEIRYKRLRVRYGVISSICAALLGINIYSIYIRFNWIAVIFLLSVLVVWIHASWRFYMSRIKHLCIVGK